MLCCCNKQPQAPVAQKNKGLFFLRHVMRPSQVDGGLQSAHSFWDMGRWHSHSREYRQSPWQIGGRNSIRRPLAIRYLTGK